jgi:hypothetical protein
VSALVVGADDAHPDDVPALVEVVTAPVVERRAEGSRRLEGSRRDGALAGLEALPRLLAKVGAKADLLRPGVGAAASSVDVEGLTGPTFVDHAVRELCRAPWPAGCATKCAEVLKDLGLPPSLLRGGTAKACRQLKEVEHLDELPGLVYQLLLMGGQQCGQERTTVLMAVLDHFHALDDAAAAGEAAAAAAGSGVDAVVSSSSLRGVEGSVLHFFNFAATQDHGLGTALLKILKGDTPKAAVESGSGNRGAGSTASGGAGAGPARVRFPWLALTPFSAALALSLASGQRFEVSVTEALGRLASDGAKHAARLEASPWLQLTSASLQSSPSTSSSTSSSSSSSSSRGATASLSLSVSLGDHGDHAAHVPRVLKQVVCASRGWDRLAPALVAFGLALVDKAPPSDMPPPGSTGA